MYVATINNEKKKTPSYTVMNLDLQMEVMKIEFFKDKAVIKTPDGTMNLNYGVEDSTVEKQGAVNVDKRDGIKIANFNTSPKFFKKIAEMKKLFKDEVSIQ